MSSLSRFDEMRGDVVPRSLKESLCAVSQVFV